jgi:hypothetical protein
VKKPKESGTKERATAVRPPAASKEAWTEEEFHTRVERANSPELAAKQTTILDALHSNVPGLSAVFNGQGAVNPAYNVYAEGISKQILRINADGRVFAFWNSFDDSGQPELGAYFRSNMENMAMDATKEKEAPAPDDKNIEQIDAGEFLDTLRTLAEKVIERRVTADSVS